MVRDLGYDLFRFWRLLSVYHRKNAFQLFIVRASRSPLDLVIRSRYPNQEYIPISMKTESH